MKLAKRVMILLGALVALVLIGVVLPGDRFEKSIFCTQEAKQCADGSFVGRGGSDCEFAACPGEIGGEGKIEPIVSKEGNIKIYSPVLNQKVSRPLVILGEARVFESTFLYALKDGAGNLLANGFTSAKAPEVGKFGPFVISLWYDEREDGVPATVEVYNRSAKDGSIENLISIPVLLSNAETVGISIYFANSKIDPSAELCEVTYSITRAVEKTQAPAQRALEMLLAGPTTAEKELGYFTNITDKDIKVQGLTIEDGVAKVDFSSGLNDIGGSCAVSAIRSQIENTLKQFESVDRVVISVNGGTEEVLEP